jgi:hypothetical protein
MSILLSGFLHAAVILLLSLATLGVAVAFAVRPAERKLAVLRPLSLATVFAVVSTTYAGLGATLVHVAEGGTVPPDKLVASLVEGLAEATVPGIFAFAVLSLAWVMVAVGMRRQD